ncbi:hypothetical protein EVAR_76169_1 [Eumeta japonica]|uniref:Uncharacterized protein n=1 Tax=Eumeta variegata TaxID=151549 RepID=A0A4C1UX95_EUMVA|nr:hypothetical protein EVAR_76169_1 [Eumeta japonica]
MQSTYSFSVPPHWSRSPARLECAITHTADRHNVSQNSRYKHSIRKVAAEYSMLAKWASQNVSGPFILRANVRIMTHSKAGASCASTVINIINELNVQQKTMNALFIISTVGFRAYKSVWGTAQCTSRGGSQATCVRPGNTLRFTAPSARRALAQFLRLESAPAGEGDRMLTSSSFGGRLGLAQRHGRRVSTFRGVFNPCARAHGLPITGFSPHYPSHGEKYKTKLRETAGGYRGVHLHSGIEAAHKECHSTSHC